MPKLADIQLHLRQAIVVGDETWILPLLTGGQNASKRLRIHRRQYETSLVTALLGKFPATVWLVGSQFIIETARQYVRQHPPRKPCISEYGDGFPEFLATCAASRVAYLREFAKLEWHIGQIAIATNQPPVPAEELSKIPAEALPETILTLQSGLRYLQASWPIDELMRLYLTQTAPDSLEFLPADVWIELCGARGEFRIERLTRGEFLFRKSISEGRSVGDAAQTALDAEADFDPGIALAALLAGSLITAIN